MNGKKALLQKTEPLFMQRIEDQNKILKPCPFCAGRMSQILPQEGGWQWVKCGLCGCKQEVWTELEDQIIATWNNRPANIPIIKALTKLLNSLSNWMEIAEDKGDRDCDYEAMRMGFDALMAMGVEPEVIAKEINCDVKWVKNSTTCKFCNQETPIDTAHLHQGEYIGECCWDERLRNTE